MLTWPWKDIFEKSVTTKGARVASLFSPSSVVFFVQMVSSTMECRIREETHETGASKQVDASASHAMVRQMRDGDVSSSTVGSSRRNRDSNGELLNSVRDEGKERVIRWEKFLPRKFIKVLLVENDDSTRHIVSALLRKCNYLVAAVADGLKAWEVLKKNNYNFDLVLTEVVMPSISGIGLLSKIMGDEICKNIPVIMMSSHDSMGVVFKCMLNGAADFLVKPVRINELRNLWQHVWRKCCSSCTKPDIESKSEQKLGEPLETESRSLHEESDSKIESIAKVATSSSIHEKGKVDEKSKGVEIKANLSIHEAVSNEKVQEQEENNDPEILDKNVETNARSREIIESIGVATTEKCSHRVLKDNDHRENILYGSVKSTYAKNNTCNSDSSPLWELSLKRPQLKDHNDEHFQGKHVLRHSDASAFSRYGNARSRHPSRPRSSSPPNLFIETNECGSSNCRTYPSADNSRNIPFPLIERSASSLGNEGEALIYGHLSTGCNKEVTNPSPSIPSREYSCAGSSSTEKAISHHPQLGIVPFPIPVGAIPFQSLCAGYVLQPIFYPEPSVPLHGSAEVQDCNNFNYARNHHPHQVKQVMEESETRADVEQTYRRIVLHTLPAEVTLSGTCSRGVAIASGSNGGFEDTSVSANLLSGNEDGFQNGNVIGLDNDHSRRDAALTKFRLKRKDRCFEKKVRYHNRKRLAEKRPRVKGQFVRQAVAESTTTALE